MSESKRESGLYFINSSAMGVPIVNPPPAGVALYFREGEVEIVRKLFEFSGDCPGNPGVDELGERVTLSKSPVDQQGRELGSRAQ